MFLRKVAIKTLLFSVSFHRTMYSHLFLLNFYRFIKRYGVDVSNDVTTPKAIKIVNNKIFWCLIFMGQQVTCIKQFAKKN